MTLPGLPDPAVVRVDADGTCYIDDEPFFIPPDVPVNSAVLTHLQLEASAANAPVHAIIHDATNGPEPLLIQVNADGTSVPWEPEPTLANPAQPMPQGTPPAGGHPLAELKTINLQRPYDMLPMPYRGELEDICAAANPGNLAETTLAVDAMLAKLSAELGPAHWQTVIVGHIRADLAWVTGDLRTCLNAWSYATQSWQTQLGPVHPLAQIALGNTVGCWRRMPDAEALTWADPVVSLLQHAGHRDLAAVRSRIELLTAQQPAV